MHSHHSRKVLDSRKVVDSRVFVDEAPPGADSEMTGMEAVMWRTGREPLLRSPIVLVHVLDSAPDWSRLVEEWTWLTVQVPRLRERVVEPAGGIGIPRWAPDPHFEFDHHLHRVRLPAPGDLRQLLDLAQLMERTPFDPSRPLWEAVLVEGLDGDRAGFLLKLHHSSMDGAAVQRMMSLAYGRAPDERPAQARLRVIEPLDGEDRERRGLLGRSADVLDEGRRLVGRVLRQPFGTLLQAQRLVESTFRVLLPGLGETSPLLARRSTARRFDVLSVPLGVVRETASRHGVTVNDVFVATVLGGIRRYHEGHGVAVDTLPVAIPIALGNGARSSGNSFTVGRFPAPVGETDNALRMRMVSDLIAAARAEEAAAAPVHLADLLVPLPSPAVIPLFRRVASAHDVQLSSMNTFTEPVYLAGARVHRLYPFGPLPGGAISVTMISFDGNCCIGVNLDPASVAEADMLVRCLEVEFEAVVDAVRKAGR